jgi:hypothetical protein
MGFNKFWWKDTNLADINGLGIPLEFFGGVQSLSSITSVWRIFKEWSALGLNLVEVT